MSQAAALAQRIRQLLVSNSNSVIATQQRAYFKGVVEHYGLKAPDVKRVMQEVGSIRDLNVAESLRLARNLIESKFHEEKSIAISVMARHSKHMTLEHLIHIVKFFDDNLVFDWATADTIASRVLAEMILRHDDVQQAIVEWRTSSNIWKMRTSAVSFVRIAKTGKYNESILKICTDTVKSPERFVQLGTGWVLRELYLANPKATIGFIKRNYSHFSREGLRYAIEKMTTTEKQKLLSYEPSVGSEDYDNDDAGVGEAKSGKAKATKKNADEANKKKSRRKGDLEEDEEADHEPKAKRRKR